MHFAYILMAIMGYNGLMIRSGYLQITPAKSGYIDPDIALEGYRRGLFPMGSSRDNNDYAWFTHIPRGILPLNNLHISKSLQKTIRKNLFEVTCDHAFENVIYACAVGREGDPENATWISEPIKNLFMDFHHQGHAHSIECWKNGELVGGLYGLHINGAFFGESMFSIEPNASKVALVNLVSHLKRQGLLLLDTQQTTPHTESMGAVDIQELDYLVLLQNAVNQDVRWGRFLPHMLQT